MASRHPLQRVKSPSRDFSLALHILGLTSFLLSFRSLYTFPTPLSDAYGGSFQFLTIIGLALAALAFGFGLLADLTLVPAFFTAKNAVAVCANPLEVLISVLYWGIMIYDKSLLFPPEYQLPFIADFGFHAMPAIMLTLDLLFFSPPWTIQRNSALAISIFLAFAYWGWVEHCFSHNGWYPYPLFEVLSTSQRVVLFTCAGAIEAGSTMALKWLYGQVNGIEKFKREAFNPAKLE